MNCITELKTGRPAHTPLICLSSQMDLASRLAAYRAGAASYLVKPLQIEHLLHTLADTVATDCLQGGHHRRIDVLELGFTVWSLIAFEHLGIGLQAVVLIFEELTNHDMTDGVAHLACTQVQFCGRHLVMGCLRPRR